MVSKEIVKEYFAQQLFVVSMPYRQLNGHFKETESTSTVTSHLSTWQRNLLIFFFLIYVAHRRKRADNYLPKLRTVLKTLTILFFI